MFFIGGVQPKTVRIKQYPQSCPHCAHNKVFQKRVDHFISLFFIPLIRIKKGIPFDICDHCHSFLEIENPTPIHGNETHHSQCKYCGQLLSFEFAFCPACGKPVK